MLGNVFYKTTTLILSLSIASVKTEFIVADMRGLRIFAAIIISALLIGILPQSKTHAIGLLPGSILIGQAKITSSNGQFISLYNNTAAEIDMSTVQLAYYNFYDLTSSKLTSSRYLPLSGKLAPHSYYLVSDGAMIVCYKMTVNAMSLGFSTTAGTVQVIQNGPANVLDSVAWSKTAVTTPVGVQTLPVSTAGFLQRTWLDGITKTAGDPWISVLPSGLDGCDLQTQLATSSTPVAPTPTAAPQKVTTVVPVITVTPAASNVGLVAPELTELFPNPAAPQTDDNDEFIELYNPNDSVFILAGYRLEVGTSYSRGYTFKAETLKPKSYTIFKITDTNLQLSNAEGQTRLLNPDSVTISETPAYEDAPEGQSWSVVGDSWQWTDNPTPSALNEPSKVVEPKQTAATTTASTTTAAKAKTATAKAATVKKTAGTVKSASTTTPSTSTPGKLNDASPLHTEVLAGVGAIAVGYALYEYRSDMANAVFKFRRYFRNRRAARA
jgi:hypothetical protein